MKESRQQIIDKMRERHWHETNQIMKQTVNELLGAEWRGGVLRVSKDVTLNDLELAANYVDKCLTALPQQEMVKELISMSRVMAISKSERGASLTDRCQQIAQELADAPADLFLRACSKLKAQETFFPSIKQFKDIIYDYGDLRFSYRKELDKYIKRML